MNDLYTILINEDHTFTHTNVKRIMRRSNLIDKIRFLVNPMYNDLDMKVANAVLQFVTPVSRTYKAVVINPSPELYKGKVEYILPVDTAYTKEAGELELTINFSYLSMDEEGIFKPQVRTIGYTTITIHDDVHWTDYIPSADLSDIANIMLMNQSIAEQNRVNAELLAGVTPVDIKLSDDKKNIYLINSDGNKVGNTIAVEELGDCLCEDGVPIVELTSVIPDEPDNTVDNVVEI